MAMSNPKGLEITDALCAAMQRHLLFVAIQLAVLATDEGASVREVWERLALDAHTELSR